MYDARYARQTMLPEIGTEGQRRLAGKRSLYRAADLYFEL